MEKENQLVVIEPTKAHEIFTTPHGLVDLLARIDADALANAPDTSTALGRKAIASSAYRVAQTKTYLDGVGKEITDKLKELPKIVDANRKYARETLDALRDKVRKPLTDWEAEQERIEAEKKAAEEAIKLREEIERCHELALLMNAEYDRKKEDERKAAEAARIEHERKIAEAAAEAARLQAEAIARLAREQAERAKIEAELAAQRAKEEARLAVEKAEREKMEAEIRHKLELEAAERKVKEEQQRKEAEAKRLADEETEKQRLQAANKEHRRKINMEILADLMAAGISEEDSKRIIVHIANGQVRHLTIDY